LAILWRSIRHNRNAVFGGINILFAGDFCQLPPVLSASLMSAQARMWREKVTTVITLTQQMRQADDVEFAQHLQSFREGHVTEANITYFNQQLKQASVGDIAEASAAAALNVNPEGARPGDANIPIVVADNDDRVSVNAAVFDALYRRWKLGHPNASIDRIPFFQFTASYSKVIPREESRANPLRSVVSPNDKYLTDPMLCTALSQTPVDGFDHLLKVHIGMEVVITTNLSVPLGIGNGSRAIVLRVERLKDGEGNEIPPEIGTNGLPTYLSGRSVASIHLRLLTSSGNASTVTLSDDPALNPGEFRVFPLRDQMKKLHKAGQLLHGLSKKLNYAITQFPLLPAQCVTGHKTQGLTLSKLILAAIPPVPGPRGTGPGGEVTAIDLHQFAQQQSHLKNATANKKSASGTPRFLYVVLSRLRSLVGLTLLYQLICPLIQVIQPTS
jgi:hypothetical protein